MRMVPLTLLALQFSLYLKRNRNTKNGLVFYLLVFNFCENLQAFVYTYCISLVIAVSSTGNVLTLHIGDRFFVKVCEKEKCRLNNL